MKFHKSHFYALLMSCAAGTALLGAPAAAFAQSGAVPLPQAEPHHKPALHKTAAEQSSHDDISDIINASQNHDGAIKETAPNLPASKQTAPKRPEQRLSAPLKLLSAPAPKPSLKASKAAHNPSEDFIEQQIKGDERIRGAEPKTLNEQVAPAHAASPAPSSLPVPMPKPQHGDDSNNAQSQDNNSEPAQTDSGQIPAPDFAAPVPIPVPMPAPAPLLSAPPEPRVNDTLEPQAAPYEAAPNAPLTYPQSNPGFWQSRNYPRFGDRKPHIWASRRKPWHYAIHGTDVSWHNSTIDWTKMVRGGISFVFIKATEGGDHADPAFQANWQAAGQVGLMRGAYHFYYFCRTPKDQLRWYIQNVPRGSNTLPPVLDMEWNHTSATCRRHPAPDEVRKDMKIFLEGAERYYHKKPIIYTTVDFFRDNGLGSFRGYPFWLRSVAAHPDDRYNRQPWLFWQYTGTGRVPGISGDADISVFVGSPKQWRSYLKTISR